MTDNRDPLEDLWQQQDVSSIDLEAIKKQWRNIRYKQYFYMFFDLLPIPLMPLMVWYFYPKFNWFEMVWFAAVIVATIAYSMYIVWLRRFSFRSSYASTAEYFDLISTQFKQNIKIANATIICSFVIIPVFGVFYAGLYFMDVFDFDRWLRKVLISSGVLTVAVTLTLVWAKQRIKRFSAELENLNALRDGN